AASGAAAGAERRGTDQIRRGCRGGCARRYRHRRGWCRAGEAEPRPYVGRGPGRGHIASRTVAVGTYVTPGQQMMAIVPLHLWVRANFKENRIAKLRPGQIAKVHIDACPGADARGHVVSIQRGAGQAFALLPPENATGNYIKVVQ